MDENQSVEHQSAEVVSSTPVMDNISAPQRLPTTAEMKGNARQEGESFEDYKKRRKIEQIAIKQLLKGKVRPHPGAYNSH